MSKIKKKKSRPMLPLGIKIAIPVIIASVVGIFIASTKNSARETSSVVSTVQRLKAMETSDITEIENLLKEQAQETAEENSGSNKTPEEIQAQILNGDILGDVEIRQAFKGTVILGDSITEAVWEYGFLDTDVVISQRGMSIIAAGDLIQTAIYMNPSVVFMAFGTNDLESYIDNVEGFISGYRSQVQKIKDALPGVPIYINLVLPITDEAINNYPALQYYPQYNEAILEMCEDMELTPIDNSFIIRNNGNLYEPDGQHVIASYYPQWLTNMAEMAGLV